MMRHFRLTTLVALFVVISAVAVAAAPFAYITNSGSGTVSLIDLSTNTVSPTTIAVGALPFNVAMSLDGSRVYVSNFSSNTVSIISTASNSVIGTINVPPSGFIQALPYGVASSPDGSLLYVARSGNGSVGVHDTTTSPYAEVKRINGVGAVPRGIAVTPDGSRVVAATRFGTTYAAIINTSTNAVTKIGTVGGGTGVVISPDGTKAYVTIEAIDLVAIVDLVSGEEDGSVFVGDGPIGLTINADGTRLYVTNALADTVSVVNTGLKQEIGQIPVGDNPQGISLNAAGDRLYVVNRGNGSVGTVSVVNLTTDAPVVETLTVGSLPMSLGTFIHRPSSVDTALELTLSPGSVIVGSAGPVSFDARLTRKDNNGGLGGRSLAYAVNGNAVGSATTAGDGTATLSFNPSALAVGTHAVSVAFSGSTDGIVFNASNASGSFKVEYAFAWVRPTNGSTTGVNAGSTIPVQFLVSNASGTSLSDLSIVTGLTSAPCASGSSTTAAAAKVRASSAGGSDLRYNSDHFMYNWRTDKAWAGSCRQFIVELNDSSSHSLTFQFR